MTDSATRTPDVCECGHDVHEDFCGAPLNPGPGYAGQMLRGCECPIRRPAAAVPVATREPTWRCTEQRSHGTCNSYNEIDEDSCGACGAHRPAMPITLDEIDKRMKVLDRQLRPHREWGECPMTGNEDCCDTLVNELRLLQRARASVATPTARSALLEAATAVRYVSFDGMCWPLPDGESEWRFRYGTPSKEDMLYAASVVSAYRALILASRVVRGDVVTALRRALPPSPAPGT